jgi:uncharacterized protein (DUF305 family)
MFAAALVASLTLAACGNSESTSMGAGTSDTSRPSASVAAGEHNDADVKFAQDMIPHHRQAVEMSKMATERASAPEVKALATKIEGGQGPEIDTMSSWLKAWEEDIPEEMSGVGHDGHGGGASMDMPGMMSAEDMASLKDANGADFDKMFLNSMIEHHRGAIEMAKAQQAKGSYGPATDLAAKIASDQQAEITEMKALLTKIG